MQSAPDSGSFFSKRSAGILLHPTSLPCSESCLDRSQDKGFGTLGHEAYKFVDFVQASGISIWQMLPTGPTQSDLSPYQSLSAHAGNPDLISLDWLHEWGWISLDGVKPCPPERLAMAKLRQQLSEQFYARIETEQGGQLKHDFEIFCTQQAYWLNDFCLFIALRNLHHGSSWVDWPEPVKLRKPAALASARKKLRKEIRQIEFEQFAFFSQWQALKHYANERGIHLFGDMPIFVGHDSADVWSGRENFLLDEAGNPTSVAGVPPDYFSETGQHWGNPHYNWPRMQADGFQWWLTRLKTQLQMFDLIRIDHFRGFEAYWSIPGGSRDARSGSWVKAPGEALLKACMDTYPDLALVAENLGVITEEVEQLRHQFNLPGMLVLQFAFDGNTDNPHLPHKHAAQEVIYTGTHDNDTTLGWYETLPAHSRAQLKRYCFDSEERMPWLLIRLALSSVARMVIIPMQDFLELDGQHRMNMPGTTEKNWLWKFDWNQVGPNLAEYIRQYIASYHRLP